VKQNAPAPSEDEDSLPRLVGVAATVPHRRATTGTSPLQFPTGERRRGQPAPTRRGRGYSSPPASDDEDSLPRLVGVAATVPHRRATTGTSPLQAERGRGQPAPTCRGRGYSSPPASDDGDVAATGRARTRTACPDSSGSRLQFPTGERRRGQPAPTRRGRRYRPSDDEDSLPRLVGVAATGRATMRTACPDLSGSPLQCSLTPFFGVCYKGLLNENASASPPEDFMSARPT